MNWTEVILILPCPLSHSSPPTFFPPSPHGSFLGSMCGMEMGSTPFYSSSFPFFLPASPYLVCHVNEVFWPECCAQSPSSPPPSFPFVAWSYSLFRPLERIALEKPMSWKVALLSAYTGLVRRWVRGGQGGKGGGPRAALVNLIDALRSLVEHVSGLSLLFLEVGRKGGEEGRGLYIHSAFSDHFSLFLLI